MIKIEKHNLTVNGTTLDLLAEFGCITKVIKDVTVRADSEHGEELVRHIFETAMNVEYGEEKAIKEESTKNENAVEKVLKALEKVKEILNEED